MVTNLQEKFLTDEKGNRIAVVLDIAVYEKLLEDLDAVSYTHLDAADE